MYKLLAKLCLKSSSRLPIGPLLEAIRCWILDAGFWINQKRTRFHLVGLTLKRDKFQGIKTKSHLEKMSVDKQRLDEEKDPSAHQQAQDLRPNSCNLLIENQTCGP